MRGRAGLLFAGAMVALISMPQATLAAGACAGGCAQVSVVGPTGQAKPGDTVTVGLTFAQAPDNFQTGGPDEVAAIALTINLTGNSGSTPLRLADCTLNTDGLPGAVKPNAALSNPPGFKVVVENASCTGRTHCLCPDASSGTAPDNFINLVVYGPNPLPAPGPNPIEIPTIPSGGLLTIDLKIESGASGTIPLHAFNQVTNTSPPPQFNALLSVGDKLAVDQTCVPVQGSPPCSTGTAVSQINITDGSIVVQGGCNASSTCAGDCDCSGTVTVTDIITMVNIALANQIISVCPPGDADINEMITVTDIVKAVNNALGVCTPPA